MSGPHYVHIRGPLGLFFKNYLTCSKPISLAFNIEISANFLERASATTLTCSFLYFINQQLQRASTSQIGMIEAASELKISNQFEIGSRVFICLQLELRDGKSP